jgi:hypothetical protein
VRLPNPFQRGLEGFAGLSTRQIGASSITTECEEMNLPRLVEAFQSPRHGRTLSGRRPLGL